MGDREIFVCDCHSMEHQYAFWYDDEDNQMYFQPHLYDGTWPWYKRFYRRIKYIFGYKSRFGAWDEMIIKLEDASKIKEFIIKMEDENLNRVAIRGRD